MKRITLVAVITSAAVAVAMTTVSLLNPDGKIIAAPANAIAVPASAPATAPATETMVEIDNFVFKPKVLTVAVGAKVTWVNKDDVPHTASSTDDPPVFDSKALDTDDKYSFTFTKPGTYKYFCKVHPHMIGSVIVK